MAEEPKEVTIEEALAHVKEWVDAGEFSKAEKGLNEIVEFAPDNQEAKDLLESVKRKKSGEVSAEPEPAPAEAEAAEEAATPVFSAEPPKAEPETEEEGPALEVKPQEETPPEPEPVPEAVAEVEATPAPEPEPEPEPEHEPEPEPEPEAPKEELPGIEKVSEEELAEAAKEEQPEKKLKKKILGIVIALVILAGIGVGIYFAYPVYIAPQAEEEEAAVTPEAEPELSEEEMLKMLFPEEVNKETDVVGEMEEFVEIFEEPAEPEPEPEVKKPKVKVKVKK